MRKHYPEIVRACDAAVASNLRRIISRPDHPDRGAFIGHPDGMMHPGASAGSLLSFSASYYCPDSRFHRDKDVLAAMGNALDHCFKVIRPDGTFDLLISNFHSAPDTGFIMHNLARAYRIMEKAGESREEQIVRERLYELIRISAAGLCNGGFHTPNHRWVVAAGLSMAHNITKEEYLREMALRYLSEGIDIDEYGEYTERSTGIYNYVNDNALLILAEEMERPEYLGYVARNLDMMLTYVEPDGSVFTQNSVRVDKGEGDTGKSFYPSHYYHLYLQAGALLDNRAYLGFADRIHRNNPQGDLWAYMIYGDLKELDTEPGQVPDSYEVFYPSSHILRKREGDLSLTILGGGSPNFLFLQKGRLRCYVRICASFFAVAQFKPVEITPVDGGYRMSDIARGSYRLPFDNPPPTSVWADMDHAGRKTVNHVALEYTVDVRPETDGVSLRVRTGGCDRVPLKVEFCFTGNSLVTGEDFHVNGTPGESLILGKGNVTVSLGTDRMILGPGFKTHHYAADMRGSLPKSSSDYTVYFTEYSNIDKTIRIRVE
ncbi:MAG: hypothetical protein R6W96_07310 [Clostridia bacterium]